MMFNIFLLTLVILSLTDAVNCQNHSPCPKVFAYSYENNQWGGQIKLTNLNFNRDEILVVEVAYTGSLRSVSFCVSRNFGM